MVRMYFWLNPNPPADGPAAKIGITVTLPRRDGLGDGLEAGGGQVESHGRLVIFRNQKYLIRISSAPKAVKRKYRRRRFLWFRRLTIFLPGRPNHRVRP